MTQTLLKLKQKNASWLGILPPQQYVTTKHICHEYYYKSCNISFQNNGNLPPRGNFDRAVIRSVVDMFSKRMPYAMISESLREQNGLHLTNTTIQSILQTGQMFLEPIYDEIRYKINTSDIIVFDETRYPVDGKSAWMWIARTSTKAQYVLEYSRGAKVPKKHWKNVKGIIVSDLMEIICYCI